MRNRLVLLAFFHFTEVSGIDVHSHRWTPSLGSTQFNVCSLFSGFFFFLSLFLSVFRFFILCTRICFVEFFCHAENKEINGLMDTAAWNPNFFFFLLGPYLFQSLLSPSGLSGLWRSTPCFGGWEGCCLWVSVTLCSDTLSDLVHAWLVSTTWGEEYVHTNTLTDTHLPFETDRPARAVGNQCCVSLPVRGGV